MNRFLLGVLTGAVIVSAGAYAADLLPNTTVVSKDAAIPATGDYVFKAGGINKKTGKLVAIEVDTHGRVICAPPVAKGHALVTK